MLLKSDRRAIHSADKLDDQIQFPLVFTEESSVTILNNSLTIPKKSQFLTISEQIWQSHPISPSLHQFTMIQFPLVFTKESNGTAKLVPGPPPGYEQMVSFEP